MMCGTEHMAVVPSSQRGGALLIVSQDDRRIGHTRRSAQHRLRDRRAGQGAPRARRISERGRWHKCQRVLHRHLDVNQLLLVVDLGVVVHVAVQEAKALLLTLNLLVLQRGGRLTVVAQVQRLGLDEVWGLVIDRPATVTGQTDHVTPAGVGARDGAGAKAGRWPLLRGVGGEVLGQREGAARRQLRGEEWIQVGLPSSACLNVWGWSGRRLDVGRHGGTGRRGVVSEWLDLFLLSHVV